MVVSSVMAEKNRTNKKKHAWRIGYRTFLFVLCLVLVSLMTYFIIRPSLRSIEYSNTNIFSTQINSSILTTLKFQGGRPIVYPYISIDPGSSAGVYFAVDALIVGKNLREDNVCYETLIIKANTKSGYTFFPPLVYDNVAVEGYSPYGKRINLENACQDPQEWGTSFYPEMLSRNDPVPIGLFSTRAFYYRTFA